MRHSTMYLLGRELEQAVETQFPEGRRTWDHRLGPAAVLWRIRAVGPWTMSVRVSFDEGGERACFQVVVGHRDVDAVGPVDASVFEDAVPSPAITRSQKGAAVLVAAFAAKDDPIGCLDLSVAGIEEVHRGALAEVHRVVEVLRGPVEDWFLAVADAEAGRP